MNEVSSELGSIRLYSSGPQSSTNQKPQFHCCDLDRELLNFSTEVTVFSAGLEPVHSHTEKPCIASYYRKFFTIIKTKTTCFFSSDLRHFGSNKTGFNLVFFILMSKEICL